MGDLVPDDVGGCDRSDDAGAIDGASSVHTGDDATDDSPTPRSDRTVRPATPADELAVRRLVDGAVLSVESLCDRIHAGEVLVAVDDETVCGTLVVARDGPPNATDGDGSAASECPDAWRAHAHLRAIAVRRCRRDSGIGTALVRAAVTRFGSLVADFPDDVRPFYESLEADVVSESSERSWALLAADERGRSDRIERTD